MTVKQPGPFVLVCIQHKNLWLFVDTLYGKKTTRTSPERLILEIPLQSACIESVQTSDPTNSQACSSHHQTRSPRYVSYDSATITIIHKYRSHSVGSAMLQSKPFIGILLIQPITILAVPKSTRSQGTIIVSLYRVRTLQVKLDGYCYSVSTINVSLVELVFSAS